MPTKISHVQFTSICSWKKYNIAFIDLSSPRNRPWGKDWSMGCLFRRWLEEILVGKWGNKAGKERQLETSFHDEHLPLNGETLGGGVEGTLELSQQWERQLEYWSTCSPFITGGGLFWGHSFFSTFNMLCGERGFSHCQAQKPIGRVFK